MVLLQKITNRLKLLLQKPNPKKIDHVNFAVTYICNSKCKYCSIWKKYKDNPDEVCKELTFEEIKNMFEDSWYLRNLRGIDLTGGEPFLRKDFVKLCGFFIQKYPQASIAVPTNSINPDLVVNQLKEIRKRYAPRNIYISISLDGIGKTHDKVRGVAGNYERVLQLIQLIKKQLPSVKQGVSFTIMPDNYKDLLEVYELSKKLDIGFCTQFVQTSESFYGNIKTEFEWNKAKLDKIENALNLIVKEYNFRQNILRRIIEVNTYYFSHMARFQNTPRRMFRCDSGTHSFFMDPYGNIYPCIMLNQRMGNIRELSFDTIWLSKKAQSIRQFIREGKCACWTPCETISSLARDYKVILWNLKRIFWRSKT